MLCPMCKREMTKSSKTLTNRFTKLRREFYLCNNVDCDVATVSVYLYGDA